MFILFILKIFWLRGVFETSMIWFYTLMLLRSKWNEIKYIISSMYFLYISFPFHRSADSEVKFGRWRLTPLWEKFDVNNLHLIFVAFWSGHCTPFLQHTQLHHFDIDIYCIHQTLRKLLRCNDNCPQSCNHLVVALLFLPGSICILWDLQRMLLFHQRIFK